MNDYLTNLISTNLNLATTLQPRVAALFEPASSVELNAGELETYERARNETVTPTALNETRDAPPMPLVVVERDARSEALPKARADSSRALDETTAAPRALEAKLRANSVTPRSAAAAELTPRVEASVPTSSRAASEPSREANASTSESPRAIVVRPQMKTVVEAAPIEPQEPAPPPVIRVTIGRVEVRAVQVPVPIPPKKKDEPSKMSLEEYLKGRER